MFGLFKKKSEKEKLQETYAKMMADAHKLSHTNRTAADKLMAEAEEVAKKIDALNKGYTFFLAFSSWLGWFWCCWVGCGVCGGGILGMLHS